MANTKIQRVKANGTTYDIDLPSDATPSVASLTASSKILVTSNATQTEAGGPGIYIDSSNIKAQYATIWAKGATQMALNNTSLIWYPGSTTATACTIIDTDIYTSKVTFGSTSAKTYFAGSLTRPYYNSSELALTSDISSALSTNNVARNCSFDSSTGILTITI